MKFDWKVILFGIVSLAVGAYLSYYFQKKGNEELLAEIRKELEDLKKTKARVSESEQFKIDQRITELNGAVKALENKVA